jgi:glutamine synthetase
MKNNGRKQNPLIVELQFTTLLGELKSIDVDFSRFKDALKIGKGVDGSSVGLAPIEHSDIVLKPIGSTYFKEPWNSGEVGCVLCDIYSPSANVEGFGIEKELELSPRFILKKQVAKAEEIGLDPLISSENEYFAFKNGQLLDNAGYMSPPPIDRGAPLRRKILKTLKELRIGVKREPEKEIDVEYLHHEVSPGQYEISLRYDKALKTADNIMRFRYIASNIAAEEGITLSFMPKPQIGINGSGMHMHMSLKSAKDGTNIFYDDKKGLSNDAKYFIGGILKHAKALAALFAPTVNSYKRLIPGFEAPQYLPKYLPKDLVLVGGWGWINRSAFIREPYFNTKKAARVEVRGPDPKSSYLAIAGIIGAGMDGMENKIEPGEPCSEDIFEDAKKNPDKYDHLPATLGEAIEELKKDSLVCNVLGPEATQRYTEAKIKEWTDYCKANPGKWNPLEVTEWERAKYLATF